VNGRWLNLFTAAVVALLVLLSFVLVAAVLFPALAECWVAPFMAGCLALWLGGIAVGTVATLRTAPAVAPMSRARRAAWRMPPLVMLPPAELSRAGRVSVLALWAYLAIAAAMVVVRVVQLAIGAG